MSSYMMRNLLIRINNTIVRKLFFVFVIGIALIASCKKNELGGKSTIKGKVVHHSKAIPYATVFIKYDAEDFPGKDTNLYDAKVKADANGSYEIKCYKGKYYLFGRGNDYAVTPPLVVGGVPVKVRTNESVEAEIAVTED